MKSSLGGEGVEFGRLCHDEVEAIWLTLASRNLRYSDVRELVLTGIRHGNRPSFSTLGEL
jgi:hypothetical protein